MGFSSGSVSFRRFAVTGDAPTTIDQALIDKFSALALVPSDIGIPEEVEYGWSGGRHVLDGEFGFESNVFSSVLHLAMRVDTNKVPGALKKAYTAMEEQAVASTNPSGFISKNQKRDVKDTVGRKMDDELRSGKFRKGKIVPVLWDLDGGMVYSSASGKTLEMLLELFERTTGLMLSPRTAGSTALAWAEPRGMRRQYEDSRPSRFSMGPEGESQHPEYPWTAKGPEPKDFLGNEFLLWLWCEADACHGSLKVDGIGDVAVMFDKSLDLDCAYGQTGKDGLRGDGPTRMPEARDGLRSGKVPRKAGLILETAGSLFSLNLNAETLAVQSAKFPQVEDADSERQVFEDRIGMLRDLSKAIDGLFNQFIALRLTVGWQQAMNEIQKTIKSPARAAA